MKAWNIIHESDTDTGKPTSWALEINHPQYGKYIWINGIFGTDEETMHAYLSPEEQTLAKALGISFDDIKDAPVLPNKYLTQAQYEEKLHSNIHTALRYQIKCRAAAIIKDETNAVMALLGTHASEQIEECWVTGHLLSGHYIQYSNDYIDGEWGTTTAYDSMYSMSFYDRDNRRYMTNLTVSLDLKKQRSTKPPVCIRIRPRSTEQIADFYGLKKEEMPFTLRYFDELIAFSDDFSRDIEIPGVNVVTSKRFYHKHLALYAEKRNHIELEYEGKHAHEIYEKNINDLEASGYRIISRIYDGNYKLIAEIDD